MQLQFSQLLMMKRIACGIVLFVCASCADPEAREIVRRPDINPAAYVDGWTVPPIPDNVVVRPLVTSEPEESYFYPGEVEALPKGVYVIAVETAGANDYESIELIVVGSLLSVNEFCVSGLDVRLFSDTGFRQLSDVCGFLECVWDSEAQQLKCRAIIESRGNAVRIDKRFQATLAPSEDRAGSGG